MDDIDKKILFILQRKSDLPLTEIARSGWSFANSMLEQDKKT